MKKIYHNDNKIPQIKLGRYRSPVKCVATLAEMKNWSRKRFGLDGVFNVEDSSHSQSLKTGFIKLNSW